MCFISLKPQSIFRNHIAPYKGCPSFKTALAKSLYKHQNLSFAQAMSSRTAKEEIEAFKANIIVNANQLIKIISTVLWDITGVDFICRDHLAGRVAGIVTQSLNNSTV